MTVGDSAAGPSQSLLRIGFDIGGTKILAGLVDAEGHLVDTLRREARPELDVPGMIDALVEHSEALLAQAGASTGRVGAVGLGFPGDFDPDDGTLKTIPNLPRLVGSRPAALLAEALAARWQHRPTLAADNDTVVAVLGEAHFGAGRGARRVLYMTVSTGVGGARFDGRQTENLEPGLRIHPDPARPEACLEALAGGAALARRVRRHLRDRCAEDGEAAVRKRHPHLSMMAGETPLADWLEGLSARHLGEAVAAGDPWARQIFDAAADQVAAGLAQILSQGWGEERIVVGGSIALRVPGYLDRVRFTLHRLQDEAGPGSSISTFDARCLLPAGLGEERGILGAVLLTGALD